MPLGDTIHVNVGLGESSGLGESVSQRFAMQEAGKDEMSLKTRGDVSLCFSIEARVGEGPCRAEL